VTDYIRIVRQDSDILDLGIVASNGSVRAHMQAYATPEQLTQFAERMQAFPTHAGSEPWKRKPFREPIPIQIACGHGAIRKTRQGLRSRQTEPALRQRTLRASRWRGHRVFESLRKEVAIVPVVPDYDCLGNERHGKRGGRSEEWRSHRTLQKQ
jgi:hypothetical protein